MSILKAATKAMPTGSLVVPAEGHNQPVRVPAARAVRIQK